MPANPVELKRLQAVTKVAGDRIVNESVTTLPEKAKRILERPIRGIGSLREVLNSQPMQNKRRNCYWIDKRDF